MSYFRYENDAPMELGYDPAQFEDQTPRSVALSNESTRPADSSFADQMRDSDQFGYLFKSTTGHQASADYPRGGLRGTIDTRNPDVSLTDPCVNISVRASDESRDLIDRAVIRDSRGSVIGLRSQLTADPARGDRRFSNSDGSTTWMSPVELAQGDRQSSGDHALTETGRQRAQALMAQFPELTR